MTNGSLPPLSRSRIQSIDVLRGVIMILMALDHTRDFFGNLAENPTNVATTTIPLFFTRWITHFCAPIFFLLTGAGAFLSLQRRSRSELARYLVSRGIWLIVLELVIMRCLGWQWNLDYRVTIITVLWALGWAMIALAALLRLPVAAVTTMGITMIVGHNLLDGVTAASLGPFGPLWNVLHAPGMLLATPRFQVFLGYPLIPWIGVTMVGYGLGQLYTWTPERRKTLLLRLGLGLTVAFVVLRLVNVYGDPLRWTVQTSSMFTLISFLNTNKYPPSLLYLLMTLGPALLALRALEGKTPSVLRPALVIGKVPLFYFIMHVPLIHTLALIACFLRYGEVHWMFESARLDQFPITQPEGWPLPLPVIYLIWISVAVILYFFCRWFAKVKESRRDWWLGYL
ncbi:MAG: DUF1624 domain-containing protein [Gemmatimonadaceae bacterium]|nr:DUF1624 domain-containing protein [Gemmatimonadaceae bacterium]MDQ3519378.1 heparan-alpha-glucosaminide N-acetyltransferase domain-containing protein [Gemmatimonadota bacterium]